MVDIYGEHAELEPWTVYIIHSYKRRLDKTLNRIFSTSKSTEACSRNTYIIDFKVFYMCSHCDMSTDINTSMTIYDDDDDDDDDD